MLNRIKQMWLYENSDTVTMQDIYPNGWDQFANYAGLEPNEEPQTYNDLQKIFNTLESLYGDSMLYWENENYATPWILYIMREELDKYNKANELWNAEIERLYGLYSEATVYNMGDILDDPDNFDKYKAGRQTNVATNNILRKIREIQAMLTPFTQLIESIASQIFKVWNEDRRFTEYEGN